MLERVVGGRREDQEKTLRVSEPGFSSHSAFHGEILECGNGNGYMILMV